MPLRYTPRILQRHLRRMEGLRDAALSVEASLGDDIERVHRAWHASARNFAHYLALRNTDLRAEQQRLAPLGLSSLGRAESHTLASITAVIAALTRMGAKPRMRECDLPVDFARGATELEDHTRSLLGPCAAGRSTHVMVTMPDEAADDPDLVRALIEAGMDCARINCAHDEPETWARIAAHTRAAVEASGRACRVLVDLPGPKLRTLPLPEGPRVLHLKPERGLRGEVLQPARVLLVPEGAPSAADVSHDVRLPLVGPALGRSALRDTLSLRDLRGRRRKLEIVAAGDGWRVAHLTDGAWLESGLEVQIDRGRERIGEARIGVLPAVEVPLHLQRGDTLWLVQEHASARAASATGPARIGCTLAEVFRDARVGEPIHFDDGRISGVITASVGTGRDAPRLEVEIIACAPGGAKLCGDRGINLPHTRFALPALTASDEEILQETARYADLVGMSFVHEPEDVLELQRRLDGLGRREAGIVLKIETARAFENLPRLILAGLRWERLGVMVARGDLGVELGFERLAEVQEEILWLCEAAHVPVIWATQVLESLAKHGQPSRAEVTDAAMSVRAECVMLNKGPYIVEAVRFLDDVLRRMQDHQQKKSSMLRRLSVCRLADQAMRPRARVVRGAQHPNRARPAAPGAAEERRAQG